MSNRDEILGAVDSLIVSTKESGEYGVTIFLTRFQDKTQEEQNEEEFIPEVEMYSTVNSYGSALFLLGQVAANVMKQSDKTSVLFFLFINFLIDALQDYLSQIYSEEFTREFLEQRFDKVEGEEEDGE